MLDLIRIRSLLIVLKKDMYYCYGKKIHGLLGKLLMNSDTCSSEEQVSVARAKKLLVVKKYTLLRRWITKMSSHCQKFLPCMIY